MKEEPRAFPTSFSQQRLWFLEQLTPGRAVYNIPCALRFKGQLDLAVLKKSLNEIVRRHEALRTTFVSVEGEPVQIVSPQVVIQFPIEDLRDIPETLREETAMKRLSEDARRPFDLARGPLLRALLLRLDENDSIFLVTMHHIISDGWSLGIFQQEMIVLYKAFVQGLVSPLAELTIQYVDYAIWQREWLRGKVLEEEITYWKERLADIPTLQLPTDRPRPMILSDKGAWEFLELDKTLTDNLNSLGRGEGVTLFMVLLTAFKIFLYRYTGQHDIIVGSPIANRTQVEIEPLIGFFVNMLALRTDLSGDLQVRQLLHNVGEVTRNAYDHQCMPFEKLVAEIQPERNMSHTPLFQAAFVLQNAPRRKIEIDDLTISPILIHSGSAKFDLMLSLTELPDGLSGVFEYNTDLFDRSTIIRMIGNFKTLLKGIADNPDCRISQLPLISQPECRELLEVWGRKETGYPRHASINELFESRVRENPDAVAIIFKDQELTYSQLNERSNRLAHHLRSLGIKRGSLVAVCLERSMQMVVSMMGILKAGGAYAPLDLSYPAQRLSFILKDTGSNVLITREDLSDRFSEEGVQLVCIDRDKDLINTRPVSNPDTEVCGDDPAYVMYTSGSTGTPKGVEVLHRGVVRLVCNTDYIQLGEADRLAHISNCSFDASTFEVWGALLSGARLVILDHETVLSPRMLADNVKSEGINVLFLTTALFNLLAKESPQVLAGIGHLMFGGEAADPRCVRKVLNEKGSGRLLHVYGPTENTTFTTWYEVTSVPDEAITVPIGRPIANTQVYVLDNNKELVPVGVPGELYIGGDGLARGYLNRPDMTKDRFVDDPFSEKPDNGGQGSRLYRTGDMVRWLPEGILEFLGRRDGQVKLRGFRIELGEIESVLHSHDSVEEAVVLLREDEPGDKRLVGYIVPGENGSVSFDDLRSSLIKRLPDYMVPSCFVQLESLPLTPNGKVDKRALPAPDKSIQFSGDLSGHFAGPRTPTEQSLVEIWSDVLGKSGSSEGNGIGIHDNFFQLGGHSLMATRVISRVNETFGVSMPVTAVFEYPTPDEFARELESKMGQGGLHKGPQIKPIERREEMPLSFAQQRLWFISQFEPNSHIYNIPVAMELKGQLDSSALQKSLNEIIKRHESLRSRFRMRDGQPVQLINPPWEMDIPMIELERIHDPDRQEETQKIIKEEFLRPFDLANGPLLRARLIRITEDDHILILTMHHIISDGWSIGVLFHELARLYESYTKGLSSPLQELTVQYTDFAVWQRQWLSGQVLDSQLSYWREKLSGEIPVLNMLTDYPRPAVQTFNGARHSLQLSKELTKSLKALSRSEHVTLFMTLLSAFKALLYRYTGHKDIIVGSPVANRNRAEIEGLIGFFVNMLVLRSRVSGTQRFLDLLSQVRETSLGAYIHQDLPFEQLVDEFVKERDISRSPLFQVTFALQNAPMEPLKLEGLELEQIKTDSHTTRFDLEVHIWEQSGHLKVVFIYNRDLFASSSIERMINHYNMLLQGIVSDPKQRISELPLMSESECRELLEVWGRKETGYPRHASIHELFEARARENSDALAIVFKDQELTYSQLNERSNRLAHHLRSLGIKRGSLVAVCLERSMQMVVSMMGILKAGGAYVPLDLSYPAQRLSFILKDTGSNVLITREDLSGSFSEEGVQLVCLDRDKDLINTRPVSNPDTEVCGDDPAYVMYTSGSTGTPKGVEVLHRGVVRLVCNMDYIQLGEADRVAHISNCSFDASTFEVWGALLSGARLVILDHETVLSPRMLADNVKSEGINVLLLTTALFNLLAKESPQVLAGIEHLMFGGEAADPRWVRRVLDEKGPGRLLNLYGPTENTSFTTWHEVTSVPDEAITVPIGRPIANTQVYVLDSNMEPVPVGVPGELYIGGDGLARGYLNRPDLSKEMFVPDPFSEKPDNGGPGPRLYRTGDMVRWLPEGILEFLGRKDDQVKLRGLRIELGEIESMLSAHNAVGDALVLMREDEPGDKRLVGYIVTNENGSVSFDDLRAFLKKRLPDYMVPSFFVQLESLPLTPNGKVDKRALPAPEGQRQSEKIYVEPKTKLEKIIANIWQELLHIDKVGIHDNFFDLGGNSLMMISVKNKLFEITKTDISIVNMFRYPTVSALVKHLRQEEGTSADMPDEARIAESINKGKSRLKSQLQKRKKLT